MPDLCRKCRPHHTPWGWEGRRTGRARSVHALPDPVNVSSTVLEALVRQGVRRVSESDAEPGQNGIGTVDGGEGGKPDPYGTPINYLVREVADEVGMRINVHEGVAPGEWAVRRGNFHPSKCNRRAPSPEMFSARLAKAAEWADVVPGRRQ